MEANNQSKEIGIAVIGMSCRFPSANCLSEYWNILKNGENTSQFASKERLSISTIDREAKANFLKCKLEEFDASFFGMSPNEAAFTDPQARLLLEVSWEALEDAHIPPEKIRGSSTGVFHGSWLQDYKELMIGSGTNHPSLIRSYTGNGFGSTSAKLSHFYGLKGPNVACESACSSSIVAVHLACNSLKSGECSLAFACGANIILHLNSKDGAVWSPDGTCKSFDEGANGYGRGEGIAVLILKRVSDALRDQDRIYGIIKGSAVSQEGLTKSFGSPTVASEAEAMRRALEIAGIDPSQVDYLEAHATGTPVGDPIEAAAINKVYASDLPRNFPLLIGSGKTNIGHTECCSGIAGIIKILLAMKNEEIPAHINLEKLNPKIDFSKIPGIIPLEAVPWKRGQNLKPRIGAVSSFGITGTDAHVIIKEAPITTTIRSSQTRNEKANAFLLQIICISAKTEKALEDATELLQAYLERESDDFGIDDIAYTANVCRTHHSFRRTILGVDKEEILQAISSKNWISGNIMQKSPPKICFTFPDTFGKLNLEVVESLFKTFPIFRQHLESCDKTAVEITGKSILDTLFIPEINECYIATFAVQFSVVKLLESWGIKPNFVIGHSMGEVIAAVIGGALSLQDAISSITGNCEINEACQHEKEMGCNVFIEIGPGAALKKVIQDNLIEEANRYTILSSFLSKSEDETDCWKGLLGSLACLHVNGVPVNWEGFYEHSSNIKVDLPHYPFQRKSFWFEKRAKSTTSTSCICSTTTQKHPLLGSPLVLASGKGSVFQNQISVSPSTQTSYLADHVIGSENHVIFPAAGYLEMMLSISGSGGEHGCCISIENFVIHSPLHLPSESLQQPIQVIEDMESVDGNELSKISIFRGDLRQNQKDCVWILHATGNRQEIESEIELPGTPLSLVDSKHQGWSSDLSKRFYEEAANIGLHFGPAFQAIRRLCQMNGNTLGEIQVPEDFNKYTIHPIVLDAMIQCYLFHCRLEKQKRLYVPVRVAKLVVNRIKGNEPPVLVYAHCNDANKDVHLLDIQGNQICAMIGLEMAATTASSLLQACGAQTQHKNEMPNLYKISWDPKPKAANKCIELLFNQNNCDGNKTWMLFHNEGFEKVEALVDLFGKIGRKAIPLSLEGYNNNTARIN